MIAHQKRLWILALTLVSALPAAARADAQSDCLAKKTNPIFWRMADADCTRADTWLDNGGVTITQEEIVQGIVTSLMAPPPNPGASNGPTGHPNPEMKPVKMFLEGGSNAMEPEVLDNALKPCGEHQAEVAYKHEVEFTALMRSGSAYIGTAAVYRRSDGSLVCVDVSEMQLTSPIAVH